MQSATVVGGIAVPSTNPVFLGVVGFHVALGVVCVVAGLLAMLSNKGRGRHSRFGLIYFWCLTASVAATSALAIVRWHEDYALLLLGLLSLVCAWLARRAIQRKWPGWPRVHLIGMGLSYTALITAFYVDNGKNLPLWRELPQIAFWILPIAVALPIMLYVLLRHPLTRTS